MTMTQKTILRALNGEALALVEAGQCPLELPVRRRDQRPRHDPGRTSRRAESRLNRPQRHRIRPPASIQPAFETGGTATGGNETGGTRDGRHRHRVRASRLQTLPGGLVRERVAVVVGVGQLRGGGLVDDDGGVRMQPNLISQLQAPDLTDLSTPSPVSMGQAISPAVAATLTDLMIGSENFTGGDGKIPGVQIASKTGTAEHGVNPRETPPHAWYIAFAPAQNPTVAVAVIVENGGDRGLAATGGSVAAPIGRAVIAAGIQGG